MKQRQHLYEDLFLLLDAGRIDYFSRGVTEIFPELDEWQQRYPHLAVEDRLALHYPFAMFFFVSPSQPRLAAALRQGFEKAYRSGRFERFFYQRSEIRESLSRGRLTDRFVLEIPNPSLTPETRAIPARYWHRLPE